MGSGSVDFIAFKLSIKPDPNGRILGLFQVNVQKKTKNLFILWSDQALEQENMKKPSNG